MFDLAARMEQTLIQRPLGLTGKSLMPTVPRLRTDSPMDVLLSIPPSLEALGGLGGLVLVAERVCTFGPRVKAQRRRLELEAEKLKTELEQAHPHDRGVIEQQIENVASITSHRPDFPRGRGRRR
jgi:hypothetical protein